MNNNVVCLRCGNQFYFAHRTESDLSGAKCPSCGHTVIGKLTYSSLFNYGYYEGGG